MSLTLSVLPKVIVTPSTPMSVSPESQVQCSHHSRKNHFTRRRTLFKVIESDDEYLTSRLPLRQPVARGRFTTACITLLSLAALFIFSSIITFPLNVPYHPPRLDKLADASRAVRLRLRLAFEVPPVPTYNSSDQRLIKGADRSQYRAQSSDMPVNEQAEDDAASERSIVKRMGPAMSTEAWDEYLRDTALDIAGSSITTLDAWDFQ